MEKKTDLTENSAVLGWISSGDVINPLADTSRKSFLTGLPLDDPLPLRQCRHCRKVILNSAAKDHIEQCLKIKMERALRKKEAKKDRERAMEEVLQAKAQRENYN